MKGRRKSIERTMVQKDWREVNRVTKLQANRLLLLTTINHIKKSEWLQSGQLHTKEDDTRKLSMTKRITLQRTSHGDVIVELKKKRGLSRKMCY